jgi:hypothetical protein
MTSQHCEKPLPTEVWVKESDLGRALRFSPQLAHEVGLFPLGRPLSECSLQQQLILTSWFCVPLGRLLVPFTLKKDHVLRPSPCAGLGGPGGH